MVTWIVLVGIPNDTLSVFACLWLGTIAWNIEAPPRRHLEFLRDWWPILVGLVIYFYSRGLADEFNRGAAFQMPIDVDRWLGGGTLPTDLSNTLSAATRATRTANHAGTTWCSLPSTPRTSSRA